MSRIANYSLMVNAESTELQEINCEMEFSCGEVQNFLNGKLTGWRAS
jgi:hypothetical protein